MSTHDSPTLTRLARSNPVDPVDDELGRSPAAQAALAQILVSERAARRRPLVRRAPRVLLAAAIALLLAVGGALAATDPFGLFRSSNPDSAIFGVDVNRHVQPPSQQVISCPRSSDSVFRCSPEGAGQRYVVVDHVQQQVPAGFGRSTLAAAIQQALRRGTISKARAQRFDRDLAAVSDHFLARLGVLFSFGILNAGYTGHRVPPPDVPALVVCEPAGAALACRDLNGDSHAAVGSGIYAASPAADWVPAPAHRPDSTWPMEVAILGHVPSAAELRLLADIAMTVSGRSSTSASQPVPSP